MTERERVTCHVCGRPTLLRGDGTMFRHRYGGDSGSDECLGSGERPGMVIPGFVGPYRHVDVEAGP
jgi:hypothetical protein